MNVQVAIRDKEADKVVWSDGGHESAADAEHAAELQLLLRDRSRYEIEVNTIH